MLIGAVVSLCVVAFCFPSALHVSWAGLAALGSVFGLGFVLLFHAGSRSYPSAL